MIALFLMLAGVGTLAYFSFHHEYVDVKCPDCDGTGKSSCGAPGCVHGFIACPNPDCLKKDDPGFIHMHVDGHPDTDVWKVFNLPNGGWNAYSQAHVGHVIQLVNDRWTDMGLCPICHGTGLAECPVCHGQKICPTCNGKGTVKKEVS